MFASRQSVEFLFDYASPWSYLADRLLARELPGVAIVHQPIYLRGLPLFSKGMPFTQAKLRYLMIDLERCAARHDLPVTLPSALPLNGLYALRGALVASEQGAFAAYNDAIWRAAWVDDRKVSQPEVVVEVAASVGLEADPFRAAIEAPALKERLRDATADARGRGVFGVPSFLVGEDLFWGHDRMDYVRRAVARLGA